MGYVPNEYGKMKVGTKTLEDAVLNLGALKDFVPNRINKSMVYQALANNDVKVLREVSNYFYKTSGIYQKACNYAATMYRYDWYLAVQSNDDNASAKKMNTEFRQLLNYFDHSYIQKICGEIALSVVKNGAYYGYEIEGPNGIILQELPINYCRSLYSQGGLPVVEFNMKFFDKAFPDTNYRMKVLNMFPDEFKKGYVAYKSGKLTPETRWDRDSGWWLLDPEHTVKFNYQNGSNGVCDLPLFINAIPAILDLDAAQDLDRRKQMQKLLKIVVQKLPMDKNGDLIFDVDEAKDIHNNAVQMLKRAVGVDVLTTFADIDSIDMSDKNTTATQDDLSKVERAVFNAMGISQNIFNADGQMSITKSIANDEGALRSLLLQFEIFFDRITQRKGGNRKKYQFRFYMLPTTQYNYQDLAKLYKEQTQLGFSKILPQIALGHSQSFILNSISFENEVLKLSEIMIPPLMSSTMSMEDLKGKSDQSSNNNSTQKVGSSSTESKETGRPAKADDEKSAKTIKNIESMS